MTRRIGNESTVDEVKLFRRYNSPKFSNCSAFPSESVDVQNLSTNNLISSWERLSWGKIPNDVVDLDSVGGGSGSSSDELSVEPLSLRCRAPDGIGGVFQGYFSSDSVSVESCCLSAECWFIDDVDDDDNGDRGGNGVYPVELSSGMFVCFSDCADDDDDGDGDGDDLSNNFFSNSFCMSGSLAE